MKHQCLAALFCVALTGCNARNEPTTPNPSEDQSGSSKTGSKGATVNPTSDVAGSTANPNSTEQRSGVVKAAANPAAELAAAHLKEVLAWQDRYRSAKKEDRPAVLKERPSYSEYFAKFKMLVGEHPSTAIAGSAHAWMAMNAPENEDKAVSFQTMIDSHADADELVKLLMDLTMYRLPTQKFEDQVKYLAEHSSNINVKAASQYALIRIYDKARSLAKKAASDPGALQKYGEDESDYIRNLAVKDSDVEAIYSSLAQDYSDVVLQTGRNIHVGRIAETGLFKLRNLSVGCIAPEIVAEDLDGVEFKLSEYRGKVVMLDFWGDW